VVMGNNCRVLEGAAIESSVIWNNVTVGRNAWLEGCIVGSNSSIGEGCSVGRGVVIGEGVTVANGIRLEPGRKVWPDTSV
jgi:translation initiation factor eIF-2B subunit epsilon